MKPSLSELLGGGAMTLATGVAPLLEDNPYGRGNATVAMMLMILAAQENEKAADALHTENQALRALFVEASGCAWLDADLRARLSALATSVEASLRISALQATNAPLRAGLIALHEAVEASAEAEAAAFDARIWRLLCESAAARLVHLPPM